MFTVYLTAVLCGVGLAAYGSLAATVVMEAVRGNWRQAATVAAMTGALTFLPVNATFWTATGLVLVAVVLLAGFVWVMAEAGKGGAFHFYGCWKMGELLLECLGVVLVALAETLKAASEG